MKEVKIADKNHPDYKKYEEKADEYKKHYDEKLENLWSPIEFIAERKAIMN